MRALGVAAALVLASCSKKPPAPLPDPKPKTPESRAVEYLVSKNRDGLWIGETTKAFESGEVLTPFILYALSHAPPEMLDPHRATIDRALGRLPEAPRDYPNYSLALSILAFRKFRPSRDVGGLVTTLRARQLTEALGWSPEDPEYGGWDEGVIPARKPQCQRPNLSVTAFACEALGGDEKAKIFVDHCRLEEGGFLFTPNRTWAHQNKAGRHGYSTTTYDAHRILGTPLGTLRSGLPRWLEMPEEWGPSMIYYEAFAEAKVAPSPSARRMLLTLQRPDGSFTNPSPLMKEDDPLVATGLALIALSLSR